jgi:hypothetical protein
MRCRRLCRLSWTVMTEYSANFADVSSTSKLQRGTSRSVRVSKSREISEQQAGLFRKTKRQPGTDADKIVKVVLAFYFKQRFYSFKLFLNP